MERKTTDILPLTVEQLLAARFCDLDLQIKGTWVAKCISRLHSELAKQKIRFMPTCFLADEWLCPDGEPTIGIPFYLVHPRLIELEYTMMGEVEGGTMESCMRFLRHEAEHAVCHAYSLERRERWQQVFGRPSMRYPNRLSYAPGSQSFVRNLDFWYAQRHPVDDFAETFAVWLNPRSRWRKKYGTWEAIEKLRYVDTVTGELAHRQSRPHKPDVFACSISVTRRTLRTHYRRKQAYYAKFYTNLAGYKV